MNVLCVHFGEHLLMDTLTLTPLCLRMEHIYIDAGNVPVESTVIFLEYLLRVSEHQHSPHSHKLILIC